MNYKKIAKEIVEIVNKQDSLYDAVDLVEEYLYRREMVDGYAKIFDNSFYETETKNTLWFEEFIKKNPNR